MASDIVTRQTKTEPAGAGAVSALGWGHYFPTTENVNTMLDLLEGQGEDRALARAWPVAESWVGASYTSKAVQTLMDWMGRQRSMLILARSSIERGEGVPWDSVKERLGYK